ncbi:MAG: hypothetical protein M5U13_13065 [Thermoanaerobaculia bacterium]|nr:hypothetical protein [Thermoanaerobaculia bacterium]
MTPCASTPTSRTRRPRRGSGESQPLASSTVRRQRRRGVCPRTSSPVAATWNGTQERAEAKEKPIFSGRRSSQRASRPLSAASANAAT